MKDEALILLLAPSLLSNSNNKIKFLIIMDLPIEDLSFLFAASWLARSILAFLGVDGLGELFPSSPILVAPVLSLVLAVGGRSSSS